MMENHLIELSLSDSKGKVLLKSSARLSLRLLDKVDANLGFDLGPITSDLDQIEVFYFLKEACREKMQEMMNAENYVYLLIDELALSFDSELYDSRHALNILAATINAVLGGAKSG